MYPNDQRVPWLFPSHSVGARPRKQPLASSRHSYVCLADLSEQTSPNSTMGALLRNPEGRVGLCIAFRPRGQPPALLRHCLALWSGEEPSFRELTVSERKDGKGCPGPKPSAFHIHVLHPRTVLWSLFLCAPHRDSGRRGSFPRLLPAPFAPYL